MRQLELELGAGGDLESFFANIGAAKDKRSLTHSLHPYPAKFIPQIPRVLIKEYARSGGIVCDPMCGSGTALVEAGAAGHRAVGMDLNPIAVLAAQAKTGALEGGEVDQLRRLSDTVQQAAHDIREGAGTIKSQIEGIAVPDFYNRDHWFREHVLKELMFGKQLIDSKSAGQARKVGLCSLSAIVVEVSNQESETRWTAKPSDVSLGDTLRRLGQKIDRDRKRVEKYSAREPRPVSIVRNDVRSLPLTNRSVDFIVTSPPYANSHDYYLYHKLRLFLLGYDVKVVQNAEIGSRNKHSDYGEGIDTYLSAMGQALEEIERILTLGGRAAIVVADAVIRGEIHLMDEAFQKLADEYTNLNILEQFRFDHRKHNTLFQSSFGTNQDKTTHVLVFERPHAS